MKSVYNVVSLLVLVGLLVGLLAESKHVSRHHHHNRHRNHNNMTKSKSDLPHIVIVNSVASSIDLNVYDRIYAYWFKRNDVYLGHDLVENEFYSIRNNKTNAYRYLTIKSPNASDVGVGSYFVRSNTMQNLENVTYFDIYLYDSKNLGASLWFNSIKYDLEHPEEIDNNIIENDDLSNDDDDDDDNDDDDDDDELEKEELNDVIELDIELDSFSEESMKDQTLMYRIEALPLSHLLVNEKKVESSKCEATDHMNLACLETDLMAISLPKKCDRELSFNLSYEYDNKDLYASFNLKLPHYRTKLNLKYPPQSAVREQLVQVSANEIVELECQVECSNPSNDLEYLWTIDGENVLCTSDTNKFELDMSKYNVKNDDEPFEVLCTIDNGIEPSVDYVHESQTVFKIFTKTISGSTATSSASSTQAPMVLATNSSSEFGFFANLYSKIKLFVSFNV